MEKVIYICDKCKKETTDKNEVIKVTTSISEISGYTVNATATKHICNQCLVEMCIIPTASHTFNRQNNTSLEDKMIELLVDLGVSFVE